MTELDIKTVRRKLGLTQEKFAQRLGVSLMTVRRWERGKCKPLPAIQKVIDRLLQDADEQ